MRATKWVAKRGLPAAAAAALVACGCLVPDANASSPPVTSPSSVTATAGFAPNKLGAASTLELGFQVRRPAGQIPPPLIGVEFHLAAGVSLTSSELGQESCSPATLASAGSKGCKPDAVMGYGNALILAPDAAEVVREPVGLTVLLGPAKNRHTTLLFYASGDSPTIAQVLFPGELLEESQPFGADLDTTIPLTLGLPGEPETTVVRMYAGIGPKGVTYYKSVHGARVAYTPKGVIVPLHCPAGGFPFGVTLRFADGSTESASTTAPCPARSGQAGSRGHQSQ